MARRFPDALSRDDGLVSTGTARRMSKAIRFRSCREETRRDPWIARPAGRSVQASTNRAHHEGVAMGDKSPHDAHHTQKSAKSIKEKRAEKKAKAELTPSQIARLTAVRKHGS
jgi:hypothetical protein